MVAETAAAAAAPPLPVTAQLVGKAFVTQYYTILHLSPELVHRFYNDISKLGRPEEDGSMSITTTMQAINDKIVGRKYGDLRAEIKSVDSQESFNGGIQVLVTGYLTGKDNKNVQFVQSVFLAPQERGYFVLNDMLRYVDNVTVNPTFVSDVAAEPVTLPVEEEEEEERGREEEEEVPVPEVADDAHDNSEPVVE